MMPDKKEKKPFENHPPLSCMHCTFFKKVNELDNVAEGDRNKSGDLGMYQIWKGGGECHRRSPTSGHHGTHYWPRTLSNEWCGDFSVIPIATPTGQELRIRSGDEDASPEEVDRVNEHGKALEEERNVHKKIHALLYLLTVRFLSETKLLSITFRGDEHLFAAIDRLMINYDAARDSYHLWIKSNEKKKQ